MANLLVTGARIVPLDGEVAGDAVDIRITDGVIAEVGPSLQPMGEDILDADGQWVIPGLWDKHVHFTQWTRALTWVDVSHTNGPDEVLAIMAQALRDREADGALIGFGYRSAAWPRPASTAELDAISGERPVAIVSGDAHNGWLNSRAQQLLGLDHHDGALAEGPWFEVFARLHELPGAEPNDLDLARALTGAASKGIVGIVDLEFNDTFREWPARIKRGLTPLRVRAGVYEHQLAEVINAGLHTGDPLHPSGLVTMGPLKVISDGSLSTRTAWCCHPYADLDPARTDAHGAPNHTVGELIALMQQATDNGLEVAIHAIGDRANQAALDAFAATGAVGSIEHAQLLREEDVERFAGLGVAASVQPPHLLDDRDLAEELWAGHCHRCYLFRSLLNSGATLAFGSDAPVSPIDPWLAIAAAVHRSHDERDGWYPGESLSPAEAIACSVDGVRLGVGAPGDVVVLGADPRWEGTPSETRMNLREMPVLATVCAGQLTH